jgi:photosystem II stability/assembly factor-like uncharacterized protein
MEWKKGERHATQHLGQPYPYCIDLVLYQARYDNGISGPLLMKNHLVLHPLCILGIVASLAAPSLTATGQSIDTLALAALKWRNIGPFRAGRSVAVAGSVKRPLEYYSGTTGGGVVKTTDGGFSWKPVTDKYFGGTIGGIAIYQPNPDIIYVGGGEHTLRGNTSHGDGVWKSTDAGQTWTFLGLKDTRHISRVIVHPWDPDIVYVAALGHAFGPNSERGVFRTKDGGKSWEKILFRGDSAGATDLQMDPSDPNVLYAATWQVVRKPWTIESGGAGSGMFKSTDGGDHWTEISHNPGLPKGLLGNMGIAVSQANPKLLWAIVEADSGGLFKSTDAGATWKLINGKKGIHWRPFYFSKVYADPSDTNTVYLPNGTLYRSTDGGKKFTSVREYGDLWDTHVLWISPEDPNRMIVGADHGARITFNKGENWSTTGYATGQFYHIIATNHFPYRVCGAQQDNNGSCGPSRTDQMFDISAWYYAGGGESGMIAPDPSNPDVTYSDGERIDRGRGISTRSQVFWSRTATPDKVKYRSNWTTPVIVSPHNPKTLYVGANILFKSVDAGRSWKEISPDLTRRDPKTLIIAGGPITKETTGAETYATIFTIAESPVAHGTLWVGTDDGLVHVSRNDGKTWKNVTPSGIPDFMRMSMIEASPHSPGTAYLAGNRNMLDDFTPYIYKSADYGETWTNITNGIPSDEFVRVVREDPVRKGLLIAGTERGVWFSLDDGAHWQSLRRNLPQVPVHDLVIKEGDIAIATHGRAMWIMDDISPLRQMVANTLSSAAHLFKPRDAYRLNWYGQQLIQNLEVGENPANGAYIYYWLQGKNQDVTLEILDPKGALVNRFTSRPDSQMVADSLRREEKKRARNDSLRAAGVTDTTKLNAPYVEPPSDEPPNRLPPPPRIPNKQGLNLFNWIFNRAEGLAMTDTLLELRRVAAPQALPGKYTVRLTSGGVTETADFVVKADPRHATTPEGLRARFEHGEMVNAEMTRLIGLLNAMSDLRQQIDSKLPSAGNASASLQLLRDSLVTISQRIASKKLRGDAERPLFTTNLLSELSSAAYGDANYPPTPLERQIARTLIKESQTEITRVRSVIAPLFAAANSALKAAGQSELTLPLGLRK